MRREFGICLLLFLITLGVYWPATHCDFTNLDDDDYILNNPQVQSGLTRAGIVWAFKTGHASNWHPLAWLSHMADCQMYGLNPHGHHLTSLFFHAANAVLLFVALRLMTGAVWRSAVVAALFAWHPLRVESVAWVSERKDVLSTFFEFLTIIVYARYAAAPKLPGQSRMFLYLLALFLFALGLLSKPMLVTLPFGLLLLDYWPLKRVSDLTHHDDLPSNRLSISRLILEKVPFLLLAILASVITYFVQSAAGSVISVKDVPITYRLGNGVISYVRYLRKMLWPSDLAVFYPQVHWTIWHLAVAVVAILVVTLTVVRYRRQCPYLIVGWLWYLGMLVPVIGLVQVGSQAMADRYTYVPLIGVFIMIVWGLADWKILRGKQILLAGTAEVALAACLALTWSQVKTWQNSIVLFTHSLSETPDNKIARLHLGSALADAGRLDEALGHYYAALNLGPGALELVYCNMAYIFIRQGENQNAVDCLEKALNLKPDMSRAHFYFGVALDQMGKFDEACSHYELGLRTAPESWEIDKHYGVTLARLGKGEAALFHLGRAVQSRPSDAEAHHDLGLALLMQGRHDEAIASFRNAVRLQPTWADALNDLAWQLATNPKAELRDGPEAVQLAERACTLGRGTRPQYLGTLDAAYAEMGRFPEAIATAEQARSLAQAAGATNVATAAESRLALYRAGRPYHQE